MNEKLCIDSLLGIFLLLFIWKDSGYFLVILKSLFLGPAYRNTGFVSGFHPIRARCPPKSFDFLFYKKENEYELSYFSNKCMSERINEQNYYIHKPLQITKED